MYMYIHVHIHVHVCITFAIIYITNMCVLVCNAELITSTRYHMTNNLMY